MNVHPHSFLQQQDCESDDAYASHRDHRLAELERGLDNRIDELMEAIKDPQDISDLLKRYSYFEAMTIRMVGALDELSKARMRLAD
jgi:hypothetical protein